MKRLIKIERDAWSAVIDLFHGANCISLRNKRYQHLLHKNIWVTDEQILACFEKNHNNLSGYYYQILLRVARIEAHTTRIIKLLNSSQSDSVTIAVAECLTDFTTSENYRAIYKLFVDSNIPKLRLEACRIANKFGRVDLPQAFANDSDRHIKKYVKQLCDESIP